MGYADANRDRTTFKRFIDPKINFHSRIFKSERKPLLNETRSKNGQHGRNWNCFLLLKTLADRQRLSVIYPPIGIYSEGGIILSHLSSNRNLFRRRYNFICLSHFPPIGNFSEGGVICIFPPIRDSVILPLVFGLLRFLFLFSSSKNRFLKEVGFHFCFSFLFPFPSFYTIKAKLFFFNIQKLQGKLYLW